MKRRVAREAVLGSVTPNSSVAQSTKAIAFRWESMTPFGTPVDPDV